MKKGHILPGIRPFFYYMEIILPVDRVPVVEVAIHLAENLKIRLGIEEHRTVDCIVNQIILCSVHNDRLVVIRKRSDKSTCRRDDGSVVAVLIDVEHAVLIEVVRVGICIALDETELGSNLISRECAVAVECI